MSDARTPRLSRRGFLGASGVAVASALLAQRRAEASHAGGDPAGCPVQPGDAAPLPATAFGPAIPDTGYLVEEIGDGLHWVTEGSYQALFLVSHRGVVVVDAPPTLAAALPAAIAEVTDKPVTHFIYSHSHGDHVGAAGVLFPDATFIGHAETAATLRRRDDPRRPVPRWTFRERRRLQFGRQRLDLVYPGPNHEPGNIMVWAPGAATLMWVDVIFPGWVPFKSIALAHDVPGVEDGHDVALGFDFETFVGGHLTRLGTRQDVHTARDYLHDVREAAGAALGSVNFFAIAAATGVFDPSSPNAGNQWLLFDAYLNEVAHVAEAQVLATWLGQLGGADIFTFGHCFAMAESIRIDDNAVADGL